MGCDCGKIKVREYTKDPDKINKFKDIEELLDKFEEGINEYGEYKKEFEKLLYLKNRCEINLELYFKVKNQKFLLTEPEEIRFYQKTFNEISKIDEKLQINPNNINPKPNLMEK